MSSLIVEVCAVEDVLDHPNADRLEIVCVKGWKCIVQKDTYDIGDLVVYAPVDSMIPITLSDDMDVIKYLGKGGRVRTTKLRGEYSQGLIIPITYLPFPSPGWGFAGQNGYLPGDDVRELLEIEKYEPPLSTRGDRLPDHPAFQRYTDIENYNNFPDVLKEGEMVVVSEKIHGCLPHGTSISMADGSKIAIGKIVNQNMIGKEVLGVNNIGQVIPTKIKRVYKNGKTDKWLNIRGARTGAGRGNSYFSLTTTPNHEVWSGSQYISMENLNCGGAVSILRSDLLLPFWVEQVLLGKLLGDGYLRTIKHSAAVEFGHKEEHREYLNWTLRALGGYGEAASVFKRISGYGSNIVGSRTLFSPFILQKFNSFAEVRGGLKRLSRWVVEELTPISLAVFYMDDGSLAHHSGQEDRALLHVCDFDKVSCELILEGLAKFGIVGVYYQDNEGYNRIRLNAEEAEKLFLLIAPYVPTIMQYKLPERYRGHSSWCPDLTGNRVFKPWMVDCSIDDIQSLNKEDQRYDIETGTHNFFANNILVHNSNCRMMNHEGVFMVGSHNVRLKEDPDVIYWKAARIFDLQNILPNGMEIFGEVYGKGVQKLQYDQKGINIAFFDAVLNGRFLNYEAFVEFCTTNDLPMVPIISVGLWDKNMLRHREGMSTIAGHIREGIVIKPIYERYDNVLQGRVILKRISERYLLKDYGDDH